MRRQLMRSLAAASALCAVLGAFGCGDSTAPQEATCKAVFSGAYTAGATDCTIPVTANWSTALDSTVVGGGMSGALAPPTLTIYLKLKGVPVSGVYRSTDPGARGFVTMSYTSSNSWAASTVGMQGGLVERGSWTLTLTSVTQTGSDANGNIYALHGSIDAVMTPTNAFSNATVKVTF